MTSFEKWSLFIGALNFIVIALLTLRITKANETLTNLQVETLEKEQPSLVAWFRNIDDKNKEMSLINTGKRDLVITYLTVKINGKSGDWLQPQQDTNFSTFDLMSLCNIVLESGQIYRFGFGSNESGGMYGGDLILQNMKGETTTLHFSMTNYGPYRLKEHTFFHY